MQGIGRHAFEDVMKRASKDIAAISALLGDSKYLGGDTLTEADCSLYGFLDHVRTETLHAHPVATCSPASQPANGTGL